MKWQDLKYGTIPIGILIILAGIMNLSGMEYSTPPDIVCDDCYSEIWVNSTYWEIKVEHAGLDKDIVFKKRSRSRTLWLNLDHVKSFIPTYPQIYVEILVPTTKVYATQKHDSFGYLRPLKEGDTLIARKNKYNPNGDRFIIHGKPNGQVVKWGFEMEFWQAQDILIDPIWYDVNGTLTDTNVSFTYCGNVSEITFYPNFSSAVFNITQTAENFNTTAVDTSSVYECFGSPTNCYNGNDSDWETNTTFTAGIDTQYAEFNYTFINSTVDMNLIYKMNGSNCTLQCYNYSQTNTTNASFVNITGLTCDSTNQSISVPWECYGGLNYSHIFRVGGNNTLFFEQELNYTINNHTNASWIYTITDYNTSLVNQTATCGINITNHNTTNNITVFMFVNETFATNPFRCGENLSTSLVVTTAEQNIFNITNQSEKYLLCWGDFVSATETKYHQFGLNVTVV